MISKHKLILLLALNISILSVFAATKTASVTGNWSDIATWGGAAAPVSGGGDDIVVNTAITVTMDANYSTTATITLNGTGTIQMAGYTLTGGSLTAAGSAVINNGGAATTLTIGSDNTSTTYAGTVSNTSGNLSLTKTGSGTLTLSGGNNITLDGAITVSAGTLKLVDCDALSVGASTVSFSIAGGATLEINANGSDIHFGSTDASGTVISGTGTFQKTGANVLYLADRGSTSEKTYFNMTDGTIDIQAGTVRNGGWAGAQWTNNYADLNVAAGAVFDVWDGNNVYVDAITGAGNINESYAGGSNVLIIGVNGGSGTFSGTITQTGSNVLSLTKQGAGTQTLSGANTFTGGLTLSTGQLNINSTTALGTGTFTIANGTTIDNTSGGSITNANNNAMTWNGSFTFTGSNALNLGTGTAAMGAAVRTVTTTASTLTVGGLITGTAGLTKAGAGTMTLGTVNDATYWTGTTTINNGTLLLGNVGGDQYNCQTWVINSGGTLQWSAGNRVSNLAVVTINSGGVLDLNGQSEAIAAIVGAGDIYNSNGIVLSKAAGDGSDFSGVISGTGYFTAGSGSSNTQILTGLNSFTSPTSIDEGTVSINTIKNVSGGASSLGAPTSVANGTISLGASGTTGILKYTGTVQSTDRVINLAGTTGGGTLDQSGTGALTFSSAFTATGAGAKTLTLQGSTAGTGVISGAIVDGASATSLAKAGTGTWTLSGANTYTGTTTLSAGILQLGAAGVIANTSNFVAAGGTFSTGSGAGYSETMGTLTLNANTIIALGTGDHSINFAASNATTWTAARLLRITGWQGAFNGTTGTSGKIYTGASAELASDKLDQIFFTHPISGLPFKATQLGSGEIVPSGTLPVQLVSFTGEKAKNTNELHWITASEINSDYFEILRSSDGINFENIGKVSGAGNSADFLSYVFVDYAPLNGMNYYKMAQYDFDGANETFNVVAISNSESEFKINALYPNPTASSMTVNFQSEAAGMYFLHILDDQGKELYSAIIAGIQGENQFNLSTSFFANGNYFVKITSPKSEIITRQIIVQH